MTYVITVYDKDLTPCGFGTLESSSKDFEEKAHGEITVAGVTLKARLEFTNPAQMQMELEQPTAD